jgi:hypothetical protein
MAFIGFSGLGQLAGLTLEERMKQFTAKTRDSEDLATLAMEISVR